MPLYKNAPQKIALLTQHQKQQLIAPELATIGIELVHTDAIDTDTLGTFDSRITRELSARETALKKAYLACDSTELEAGLGSEGSFNSEFGLGIVDQEIIAYVDKRRNIEIVATVNKALTLRPFSADSKDLLLKALAHFSEQQAWHFMRSLQSNSEFLHTGIKGFQAIVDVAAVMGYPVHLSPDFRAMNCPQRTAVIKLAAQNLVQRLSSLCPKCEAPDFVFTQRVPGLPCEICDTPTSVTKAMQAHCSDCGFAAIETSQEPVASAFYCGLCNP